MDRKDAFWILNSLPAIGPITLNRLLEQFGGDPVAALNASASELQQVPRISRRAVGMLRGWEEHFDLEREKDRSARLGARFITGEDEDYPSLLREISDPPIGLHCIGQYDFAKPCVSIVGSRRTTLYGQGVSRDFGRELARRGFCVVSGMARGIDTFAHKGALEVAGGSTVAVLGNGLDIIYPPENVDLYKSIPEHGAVVSEFPLGRRADRQTFPMRNRVVSGMSHAIIVVESDESGGSLITAKFAGEQGRLVCAVPGRIDQATSRGCHLLIRDGAVLLTSIDDLLSELQHLAGTPSFELAGTGREDSEAVFELDELEARILEAFRGGEALDVERLSVLLDLSSSEVAASVMMLELKGAVAKRLDGRYEALRA